MSKHMANATSRRQQIRYTSQVIWREKQVENRIGEWLGSFVFISTDEAANIILVQKNTDSPIQRFNFSQVKHFITEGDVSSEYLETLYFAVQQFTSPDDPISIHMTESSKDQIRVLILQRCAVPCSTRYMA